MKTRRVDKAGLVIALGLLVLSGVVLLDMSRLQLNAVYGVGPKAMLIVVAVGLAILGVGNGVLAFTGGLPERETVDMKAIVFILAGLGALIGLMAVGGGFIPATGLLFACVSAGFGRKAFLVDLLIGLALGLVAYLLFAKLLSLTLPVGPIERLL